MVRIGEDRTEWLNHIPARYQVIVTVRPKYACPKGRTGVVQARAPAHLLEGSRPTEALLAQIAVSKHSEHMPLNRQAAVMARHGVPIDCSVLADWMGRTGAVIAPVVDHMAMVLKRGSSRLYVDETAAPVLDPGRGKTKTGYLWAVLRDDRGWNGSAPPGVVFHYRPGRKGEYAAENTRWLQRHDPGRCLRWLLAPCYARPHGRRSVEAGLLLGAWPQKTDQGQAQEWPIVDEALLRIAALYQIEDGIRGSDPDHRRAVRQNLSRSLVDEFFTWLAAQAARVSRKSDLGEARAYRLKRQDGFRLFLDDGCVDIDSNLVENANGGFTAGQVHTLAAYWVMIVVSIHIGFRWSMIMTVVRNLIGFQPAGATGVLFLRLAAAVVAISGIFSSFELGIGEKLMMQMSMDFWDLTSPPSDTATT